MAEGRKLRDVLPDEAYIQLKDKVYQHLDQIVIKEYRSGDLINEPDTPFKQKYVYHWYLLENFYAVGFNENPSTGWSFPVTKYGGRNHNYLRIIYHVKKILQEYPDVDQWTLRQMYYRLVARHIIPNTINEYKKLSSYLTTAREDGVVDYKKFEDRARKVLGYGDTGYESIDQFIENQIKDFLKSYRYFSYKQWLNQKDYIELWLEKDALSSIFKNVGDGFNLYTCPTRGYPSYSYVIEAVERFSEIDKPITILYFGDFDPSGLNIPDNLIERIYRYGDFDEGSITLERIALNPDQINQYQLPPAPAKRTDVRFKGFVEETGTDQVVELDALEPTILRDIIKEAISQYIDSHLWNEMIRKTSRVKERLKDIISNAEIDLDQDLIDELKEDEDEADEY